MTKRILTTILLLSIVISSVSCKKEPIKEISTSKTSSSTISSSSLASDSKASSSKASSSKTSSTKVSSSKSSTKVASIAPVKTAFQYFDEADKKMDTLKSFAFQENGTFNMVIGGMTVNGTSVSNIKADTLNNQKRFTVDLTSTINGEVTATSACYNGKYYVKQEDNTYIEKTFKEYLEKFPDVWSQDESEDIPDILASDIVSSTKGTYAGGTTVSLVVNGSKFNEYMSKSFADDDATVSSVILENVTIDVKVNSNGYYDELSIHMKGQITQTSGGTTTSMSIDFTNKQIINSPGTAVAVTLPTNLPQ